MVELVPARRDDLDRLRPGHRGSLREPPLLNKISFPSGAGVFCGLVGLQRGVGIMMCAFKPSLPDPIKQNSLVRSGLILKRRPRCLYGARILSHAMAAIKVSVWLWLGMFGAKKVKI